MNDSPANVIPRATYDDVQPHRAACASSAERWPAPPDRKSRCIFLACDRTQSRVYPLPRSVNFSPPDLSLSVGKIYYPKKIQRENREESKSICVADITARSPAKASRLKCYRLKKKKIEIPNNLPREKKNYITIMYKILLICQTVYSWR